MLKLYLKEALEIFQEVNPQFLLVQKMHELEELESAMQKFASLYGSTVQCMWDRKEYSKAISLERWWAHSPLHREHKKLRSYVYEIKSLFGRSDRLSQMDIERARGVSLARVLGRKGPFKCPFHNEKTPSLHIKANHYKCFGCNQGGDAIDFVMKTNRVDFNNAVLFLKDYA